MIRFERTSDLELVRLILTHRRIWPWVGDDSTGDAADFRPNDHADIWNVLAFDGAECLGLFIFVPLNAVCFDVHVAILPAAWGPRAAAIGAAVFGWMWAHSPAVRCVASVAADNRRAVRYAAAWMDYVGTHPKAFLRGGKLRDLVLFGISKG